jgi:hypothetical protein
MVLASRSTLRAASDLKIWQAKMHLSPSSSFWGPFQPDNFRREGYDDGEQPYRPNPTGGREDRKIRDLKKWQQKYFDFFP